MPGLLKTRQRWVFSIILDIFTATPPSLSSSSHRHHLSLSPHYHLETSTAPRSNSAKVGFQSSFQYNKPKTIRHVYVGLPGSERIQCVWRSVYSNVVLRSSPIWMKTCGRLLFGRNLCGSSLCVAMWLRMIVGETISNGWEIGRVWMIWKSLFFGETR